ncbi:copper resistance protein CopC [Spirillospora sp. NPDC029432]|uniref:copper resistance CopC family protein n=1 Tax=Spirillospora sp. NPDC029432 TaxID=3154599 RepID=UPI003456564D
MSRRSAGVGWYLKLVGPGCLLLALGLTPLSAAYGLVQPGTAAIESLRLVSSDPGRDEKWRSSGRVELVFSVAVDPARVQVQVRDDVGGQLEMGRPEVAGVTVRQRVSPGLSTGRYSVTYSVSSRNGALLTGDVPFRIAGTKLPAESVSSPAASRTPKATDQKSSPQPSSITSSPPSAPRPRQAPQGAPADRGGEGGRWPVVIGGGVLILLAVIGVLLWRRRAAE